VGPKPQQASSPAADVGWLLFFAECSCSIGPAATRAAAEAEDIINKLLPFKQVLVF
jgi:hypothetical protein